MRSRGTRRIIDETFWITPLIEHRHEWGTRPLAEVEKLAKSAKGNRVSRHHSSRSTRIGSVRAARTAGTIVDSAATVRTITITALKVIGSKLETPYSIPESRRTEAAANARPMAQLIVHTRRP